MADDYYRTYEAWDFHDPYSMEDIKRIIAIYAGQNIEPEISISFRDKPNEYMIIGYADHVSFQRCGYKDGSGEVNYPDFDVLLHSELVDGICLSRDWDQVTDIWCEPDIRDMEAYRKAVAWRRSWGNRYYIYKAVKKEINQWNPYQLLSDAPNDEFSGEIEEIARLIKENPSTEEIAAVVSKVFSEAFGSRYFTTAKCKDVAAGIRAAIDGEGTGT